MYLSKSDILNCDDLKHADVDCPEWGGLVRVRELTARERDRHEAEMLVAARKTSGDSTEEDGAAFLENVNARIAALGALEPTGEQRLFANALDVLALGEKSSVVVTRIADKIADLSGMNPAAAEDVKGNSGAVPSGGNESGSPATSESSPTSSSTD